MSIELSREEIADIRSDGPQVVTDGSWQALCDMALAHLDSKEAGRVSVPCKMFAACVLWLEQAAEFGIDAKYGDGTPTPNSQNIAALLSELRTLSAAPAPAAQDTPFANCSFRHCDLPGQCRGEGKCHHPAATKGTGWQPIETAPHDKVVWLCGRDGVTADCWGHYAIYNAPKFTHWMPLPAAPSPDAQVKHDDALEPRK